MIQAYQRTEAFIDQENIPHMQGLPPLCDAEQVKSVTGLMINQQCRVISYKTREDCKDINGCIELLVDASIQQDPQLYDILIQAITHPCSYIPSGKRFHWKGFSKDNRSAAGILKCGKSSLPYDKAYINFGDERVEVELSP